MTASSASARMDARCAPPPRASPSDRRSTSGRPTCSATLQAFLANQMGTHARQVAFVGAGKAFEKQAGDSEAEHHIAEEFEPFIVIRAETAVRECTRQQLRLAESVADPFAEVRRVVRPSGWSRSGALAPDCPRCATWSAPRT